MKYVFAYDLDGTLLRKDNSVHPFTLEALKKVEKNGHINVIATGRGVLKVIPLIKNKILEGIDYIVCSNGSLIYDVLNDKITVLASLHPSAFEVVKRYAIEKELILTIDTDKYNGSFISQNDQFPSWLSQKQIMDLNLLHRATLEEMEKVVYDPNSKITQMALRNPIETALETTKQVESELDPDLYEVYLTNEVYTDVNPRGVSKITGLYKLLENLNLSKDSLVTFGDSGNDVHMLEGAAIGVSMGNGTDEAKAAANIVIGDHESGTIGEYILSLTNLN
ncbi:HAD family hydrolase [Mycoplasmopsis gallinacea]|uniref:Cof-type HAD-IIB family hydrolase n=1 Tax=Mycoplasmopsis gallinacea TaxID=29556 RepID=A0A6H0V2S6_9BACT|nr:HAD family hydrolase [Mycoplasmopsis gallinacea]QIW62034.1 Cof-type HAD-IIB family hydrolase [Mycoplasmopsis gallinacea]